MFAYVCHIAVQFLNLDHSEPLKTSCGMFKYEVTATAV